MVTIEVKGAVRIPDYVQEQLDKFTTIKECVERQEAVKRETRRLQEEIDELEGEQAELEEEEFYLPTRIQQILEADPQQAEQWALHQAIHNPNQQKFAFQGVEPVKP